MKNEGSPSLGASAVDMVSPPAESIVLRLSSGVLNGLSSVEVRGKAQTR